MNSAKTTGPTSVHGFDRATLKATRSRVRLRYIGLRVNRNAPLVTNVVAVSICTGLIVVFALRNAVIAEEVRMAAAMNSRPAIDHRHPLGMAVAGRIQVAAHISAATTKKTMGGGILFSSAVTASSRHRRDAEEPDMQKAADDRPKRDAKHDRADRR